MFNTSNARFFDDVLKPSYDAPVVVMFHASWCGPCKAMKPLVERLASDIGFTLVGVDAGAERELAATESVRAVPTLIVYKDGKAVGTPSAGGKTEVALRNYLLTAGVGVEG